jgi:hypothetical protein
VAAVALITLLAMGAWHFMRGHHAIEKPSGGGGADFAKRHIDVRTLDRASVAGTIRDQDGKPIVAARVCADASNLPHELRDESSRFNRRARCVRDREFVCRHATR